MPCGQGSKLVWGGLVTGVDVVISTARYQTALDHAVGDLTVTATAGTSCSRKISFCPSIRPMRSGRPWGALWLRQMRVPGDSGMAACGTC